MSTKAPTNPNDARRRADAVLEILNDRLASGDFDLTLTSDDPVSIADRMTSVLGQSRHPLADRVGPVYTTASLMRWKGVSKQAIHNAVKQRRLLGFKTANGVWLYPAYQFGRRGEYLPDLPRVLALLDPTGTDRTTPIIWLNEPDTQFSAGGTTAFTPAELLREGRAEPVLRAASEIRSAWAS